MSSSRSSYTCQSGELGYTNGHASFPTKMTLVWNSRADRCGRASEGALRCIV